MARTQMDTIIFSAIVFMLLFVTTTAQASGSGGAKPKATDLMIEACKNATLNNAYADPVREEFCLTTLQSDNRSAEAKDLRDLLQVTVDILRGRVTTTSSKVKKMLENTKKGTVPMRILSLCEVDYDTMVSVINICDAIIRDYQRDEGRQWSKELVRWMDMARDHVNECISELVDMPAVGALVNKNNELEMLVKLNTALVAARMFPE
ncbi:unnamed protein product [Triticum turgidum subsp. durum]|uniref:Pectinesterase inhibitor domain-containing protein n=1 Tax=Triticum turgidum subsp. durum TaxID=4567 RepID=A0A9R0Z2B7_TRITD|nr:unnamed protein product [Triticum turgidum subsp. durum]VAI68692.1 unnamed protein product [Triticum turgidum subsp. durum]